MPQFRVILTKREYCGGYYNKYCYFNPFLHKMPEPGQLGNWVTIEREWIFEADDEAHVRQLHKEAVDAKIEAVIGFELTYIEKLADV